MSIKKREWHHRAESNITSSNEIPSEYDWEMRVLETCPKDNQFQRERAWYDVLMPLCNKNRPWISKRERNKASSICHSNNPEARKISAAKYRDNHRDTLREKGRLYQAQRRAEKKAEQNLATP